MNLTPKQIAAVLRDKRDDTRKRERFSSIASALRTAQARRSGAPNLGGVTASKRKKEPDDTDREYR